MKSKIGIIDIGINNICSLINLFNLMNVEYKIITSFESAKNTDKIILPGVGSFSPAMKKLRKMGLDDLLIKSMQRKVPILGICLGMQLFCNSSEEGNAEGLSLINGNVKKIAVKDEFKLPHIGWNEVDHAEDNISIFKNLENKSNFYFANSYSVHVYNDKNVKLAYTNHSNSNFISAFQKENLFGVQFHPEKSQIAGIQLINNFLQI